ncbi:MAG: hypothetical protein R3C49_05370 [Planctomycetaceae bacterium]
MGRRRRGNHSRFSLFVFQDIITCVMGIMLLITLMLCLQISSAALAPVSKADETIRQMQRQAASLTQEIETLQQTVDEQITLLTAGAIDDPDLLRNRALTLENDNSLAKADLTALWQQQVSARQTRSELERATDERSLQPSELAQLQQENARIVEELRQLKSGDRVVYNAHTSSASTCWLVEMTGSGTFLAGELGKKQPPLEFKSRQALISWIQQRHRSGAVFMLIVKPDAANAFEQVSEDLRKQNITFGFDLLPQNQTALGAAPGGAP